MKTTFLLLALVTGVQCYSQNNTKCIPRNESGYTVYEFVDEFPEYPEGNVQLFRYITNNLDKSKSDNKEIQTRLTAEFIIDVDGSIKNIKIADKTPEQYTNLDKEFIEIIRNMPAWRPGKCNGEKVPVLYRLPMHIDLKK